MILYERRASSILYNFLASDKDNRPFLLPANVCPIVPLTFLKLGRPFELVDISSATLAMDPRLCLNRLSERPTRYGGVLFVHTYGARLEVTELFESIKRIRPELRVVDDRCLCPPEPDAALLPGADLSLYSTGYAKYVDLGAGGFGEADPSVPYERHSGPFHALHLQALERAYKRAIEGKRRLSPHSAAGNWLDLAEPPWGWQDYRSKVLAERRRADEQKQRLNRIYSERLPEEIKVGDQFNCWRFQVAVAKPDLLVGALFESQLFASRHYAPLGALFGQGSFPVAEGLHQRVVNLFNDRYFSEEQAHRVCDVVLQHLERFSG